MSKTKSQEKIDVLLIEANSALKSAKEMLRWVDYGTPSEISSIRSSLSYLRNSIRHLTKAIKELNNR